MSKNLIVQVLVVSAIVAVMGGRANASTGATIFTVYNLGVDGSAKARIEKGDKIDYEQAYQDEGPDWGWRNNARTYRWESRDICSEQAWRCERW